MPAISIYKNLLNYNSVLGLHDTSTPSRNEERWDLKIPRRIRDFFKKSNSLIQIGQCKIILQSHSPISRILVHDKLGLSRSQGASLSTMPQQQESTNIARRTVTLLSITCCQLAKKIFILFVGPPHRVLIENSLKPLGKGCESTTYTIERCDKQGKVAIFKHTNPETLLLDASKGPPPLAGEVQILKTMEKKLGKRGMKQACIQRAPYKILNVNRSHSDLTRKEYHEVAIALDTPEQGVQEGYLSKYYNGGDAQKFLSQLEQGVRKLSGVEQQRAQEELSQIKMGMAKQMLRSLVALKQCGIRHGDIKLENFLVEVKQRPGGKLEVKVVMADFGTAKLYGELPKKFTIHTNPYDSTVYQFCDELPTADKMERVFYENEFYSIGLHTPQYCSAKDKEILIANNRMKNWRNKEGSCHEKAQQMHDTYLRLSDPMDTFALGVSLFKLFAGQEIDETTAPAYPYPFAFISSNIENQQPIALDTSKSFQNELLEGKCSLQMVELIRKMCDPNPDRRPSPRQAMDLFLE